MSNIINIYFVIAITDENHILNSEGKTHSKIIGDLLKNKRFNKVYTSPISGYLETLITILNSNNKFDKLKRIVLDSNLSGLSENQNLKDFIIDEVSFKKMYSDYKINYERVSSTNWLVKNFIDNVKKDSQDNILVVTNERFLNDFFQKNRHLQGNHQKVTPYLIFFSFDFSSRIFLIVLHFHDHLLSCHHQSYNYHLLHCFLVFYL